MDNITGGNTTIQDCEVISQLEPSPPFALKLTVIESISYVVTVVRPRARILARIFSIELFAS
jgi:hypothetical protein